MSVNKDKFAPEMAGKNIQYTETDSINNKSFDAKDNSAYITLKSEQKNWIDDSLLGKTIFSKNVVLPIKKNISVADTLTPPIYFISKKNDYSTATKHKYIASIFSKHYLQTQEIIPKFKPQLHNGWNLSIFLIGFSLLGMANYYYIKRFNLFAKAFFLQRFTSQLMREDNSQTQRLSIILSSIYLISVSLFAFKLNQYFKLFVTNSNPLIQFFVVLIGVLSFFVLKILVNYLVGNVFKTEKQVNEYVFNIILINQFLGLALFFLCFCLYFSTSTFTSILIGIGAILILAIYLYRIIRGVLIGNNNKNISAVYLFLYFCTLEILPLIFITKLMMG